MRHTLARTRFSAASIAVALIYAATLGEPLCAAAASQKHTRLRMQLKTQLARLQADPGVPIVVRLRNGTRVAGHVQEVNDYSFILTDHAARTSTQVAFAQVQHLNALSTRAKVTITIGVAAAAVLLYVIYMGTHAQ
jgi:hypothetical protein